jgi:16S rRNA processing protein RimM
VSKQSNTEWVTVGQVVALFGVRGELKVRLLTDIPNRFTELDAVYIGQQHTRHVIESVRPYKSEMLILKLANFDDANAAEALRNVELQIPLSKMAKLPPDSYYQHDILGLQVLTLGGKAVGTIVDIIVTGSNDVYVVKTIDGTQQLIPAIKDVIKQIDLIRRTMHIDPIPGLLDNSDKQNREEEEFAEEAKGIQG